MVLFTIKWRKNPYQQAREFHGLNDWPSSTESCCHNCCHPFEGVPVPLPYVYHERKQVYLCSGNFCSWQCAKAYNIQITAVSGKGNRNMYISLLAHKTWLKLVASSGSGDNLKTYAYANIHPAPPRETLRMFGGDKTIQQYREGSFGIVPPKEACLQQQPVLTLRKRIVLEQDGNIPTCTNDTAAAAAAVTPTRPKASCFSNARSPAPTLMTKRKRKTSDTNTLMSSMGVVVEKKKK